MAHRDRMPAFRIREPRGHWRRPAVLALGLAAAGPAAAEEPAAWFLEPFPDVIAQAAPENAPAATGAAGAADAVAEPAADGAADAAPASDGADPAAVAEVQEPDVADPIGGPLTPDMMPDMVPGGPFRGSASLAEALGPAVGRNIAFGVVPTMSWAPITATLVVEPGDTMAGLFTDAGIGYGAALEAIESLQDVWDPRQLRPGQQVALTFVPAEDADSRATLVSFALDLAYDRRVSVSRNEDGSYAVLDESIAFDAALFRAVGTIDNSLYADGNAAGVPDSILLAMTRAFSYDVDFQRDFQPGDGFETVFEQSLDGGGGVVANGALVYAALTLSGETLEIYRFTRADGSVDYFTPEGASVRKALLRTPVDAARISSGFGMRRHPVLGYTRMHRGLDFAAPTGTPVYAAGDGTIAVAGWNSGYGNYVRIRHNGSTQTAYGHLSRFAQGISAGDRVEQGQVIGYVGSTGLATGPHLHYEILVNGAQVDPLSVQLPPGEPLAGADLARFQAWRGAFDAERLAMTAGEATLVAAAQ
ncbi:MAG: M23 family metallopeptidase [Alphaproteobacteria bacterium]